MKQFFEKNQLALFLWFFGCQFYFESLVRVLQGTPYFGVGLGLIALFCAAVALLCTALCSLLPRKGCYILSIVLMALLCTLYVVQMFYFFMFSTYLTMFSIINGMEALGFGGNIWAALTKTWGYVVLMLLPFVLFIIFSRKTPNVKNWRASLLLLALAIALTFGIQALLPAFGTGYFSPYDYYYRNPSLNQSVDKLGLMTTFRLNAQRYFFGESSVSAPASAQPAPAPPAASPTPAASASADAPAEATQYQDNVLDIDFDSLIANAPDDELRAMHEYFSSVPPTKQNEYTGMFEGYNLITVTAEAFAPYAIDEKLTPTLYKMYQEGFQFTDFYCPEWEVSTSDGEYVNCLSLIPKQGVWSLYLSGKRGNALPFALGNQFSALGYQTNAYHNNTYTYYDRHLSHPNMGYTYQGLGNGLEVEEIWPESDLEMIELSTPDYLNKKPFHTYYMTVSGHMAYTWDENAMSRKHRDLVDDLPLSEEAKAYLACNIELDRAMAELLKRLEEAGVAEKTVIAISPDHPPYGLTRDQIAEFLGHDPEMTFEYAKSVFLLYNPGMQPQVIDKPCGSLDILPTLSNLFGLPYDSRLLMGRDIFSDAEPLVIFGSRSFVTDQVQFDSGTGVATPRGSKAVSPEYVEERNAIIADKFRWSPKILDRNYYATLR